MISKRSRIKYNVLGFLLVLGLSLWRWLEYKEWTNKSDGIHQIACGATSPGEVLKCVISTDPREVFERLFWRRPECDDLILNAERREWSDEAGIERWECFLVVDASPSLIDYLRRKNVFDLMPSAGQMLIPDGPRWFKFDPAGVVAFEAPQGGLWVMFSKSGNRLYAVGSGLGFAEGALLTVPSVQHKVGLNQLASPQPSQSE